MAEKSDDGFEEKLKKEAVSEKTDRTVVVEGGKIRQAIALAFSWMKPKRGGEVARSLVDPKGMFYEDSYFLKSGEKLGRGAVLIHGNEDILYRKQEHFSVNIQRMYEVIMQISMDYAGRLEELTEAMYRTEIEERINDETMSGKRGEPRVTEIIEKALDYYDVIKRNQGVPFASGYFYDGKIYVDEGNHRVAAALAVDYPLVVEFKRGRVDKPGIFKGYPKIERNIRYAEKGIDAHEETRNIFQKIMFAYSYAKNNGSSKKERMKELFGYAEAAIANVRNANPEIASLLDQLENELTLRMKSVGIERERI